MKKSAKFMFFALLYVGLLAFIIYRTYLFVRPQEGPDFDDRFKAEKKSVLSDADENPSQRFHPLRERQVYFLNVGVQNEVVQLSQELLYSNFTESALSEIKLYLFSAPELKNLSLEEVDGPFLQDYDYTNHILTLRFSTPLPPKKSALIKINCHYELNRQGRTAFTGKTLNMANFYFQPCILKEGFFEPPLWMNFGEGYVSEMSDFYVKIQLPKTYHLASCGEKVVETAKGNQQYYEIQAKNIRDFVFFASPNYILREDKLNGIHLHGFFLTDNEKVQSDAFQHLKNALTIFESHFGPYPYRHLSLAFADYRGAMEYGGLIMVDAGIAASLDDKRLERVIVHETAHQWWYGLVGNDQGRNPWLDESLASFSEYYYWYHQYGKAAAQSYANHLFEGYFLRYAPLESPSVRAPITAFSSEESYRAVVYRKGALAWKSLADAAGMDKIKRFLRQVYQTFRYRIVSEEAFLTLVKENFSKEEYDLFMKFLTP